MLRACFKPSTVSSRSTKNISSRSATPPENQEITPQGDAESREITFFVPKGSKNVEVIGTSTSPSSSSLALTITGSR